MKKKLEADLISIAHRILKLKNKSDINQLYLETQKLYEKLAILKFVDENFDEVKPTINHSEISAEIETIFEKEETKAEIKIEAPVPVEEIKAEETPEPVIVEEVKAETPEEIVPEAAIAEATIPEEAPEETPEPVEEIIEEPITEPEVETIKETEKPAEPKNNIEEFSFTTINELKPIPDFIPAFELDLEEVKQEIKEEVKEEPKAETKGTPIPIAFEDFGINYADAQFVKVDSFEAVSPAATPDLKEKKIVETAVLETSKEPKSVSLNEKLAKGFHIDLNDRIAFTKNLFGNSTEDYSRVLNQLLTFDSYAEAQEFIENMVKPDYNNWEGKDDYAERFLGIIEKKFS